MQQYDSIVVGTLSKVSIRQNILWMDNVVDIWKDLKSRYSQGDLLHISNLQQELASIKQSDTTIIEYFIKLRVMWDELDSYRPDLVCTCETRCSCDAFVTMIQRKTQDQVMQFLR